jgi:glucose/arabinose dehydrogenase
MGIRGPGRYVLLSGAAALLVVGAAPPTLALPTGFQETVVFSGLDQPTAVRFSPDGRVFVAEKTGLIKVFDNLTDTTPAILIDLRTKVNSYWDRGLLGLALHPNFPTTPYLYVLYTYDYDPLDPAHPAPRYGDQCPDRDAQNNIIGPGATVDGCVVNGRLARFAVQPNNTIGSEQVLLENRWCQQGPTHSIGSIVFGDEGALYMSAGDGAHFDFEDWGQYGGTRPFVALPTPANPCNDLNTSRGTPTTKPGAEGGALRSQAVRTPGDNLSLDGSVLRLNPDTGAAWPTNPFIGGITLSDDPIVAYGLRNPFRIAHRPGTSEIWVGDVGWYKWEEIDRIRDPDDSVVENFGWPCIEGPVRPLGYNLPPPDDLTLCRALADSAATSAYYTFEHGVPLYSGDTCDTGSGSSITGLAFYTTGDYPAAYQGALFFADYSRNCVWVMTTPPGGDPSVASRTVFLGANANAQQVGSPTPVDLQIGPSGDLFVVDHAGGTIRRIRYNSGNSPPNAVISANPSSGPLPLTVQFDGSGSSDPDPGTTLSFAWDLDGDGQFDDATTAQTSRTYTIAGPVTVRLRVNDGDGGSTIASKAITAGNAPPTATIVTPTASATWRVGQSISFSGQGQDPEQGALGAASMSWNVILHHCLSGPGTCHDHSIQTYSGVASGSFTAPDHPYYSELEFVLTVMDGGGLNDTASVTLAPQAVFNTFQSSPTGASLSVVGFTAATTFTHGAIVGSTNSLVASSPQNIGGTNRYFTSWADGGGASRTFVQDTTARTYTANFASCVASETTCDGLDNDCDGTIDDLPAPARVQQLELDRTAFVWTSVAGASNYDIVRGGIQQLASSGLTAAVQLCLGSGMAGTTHAPDPTMPPIGKGFWYLVRANNCGVHGTWDSGAASQIAPRDAAINASPFACP